MCLAQKTFGIVTIVVIMCLHLLSTLGTQGCVASSRASLPVLRGLASLPRALGLKPVGAATPLPPPNTAPSPGKGLLLPQHFKTCPALTSPPTPSRR